MFDTAYYNQKLTNLRVMSVFSGSVAVLVDTIDAFESLMVGLMAQEANRTGSPVASTEELGDYFQRGKGSLAKGTALAAGALGKMGAWAVKMINQMMVFAVKGFRGTVSAAVRVAEEIGSKIEDMQNVTLNRVLTTDSIKAINDVLTEHSAEINITIPTGEVAKGKAAFMQQFNNKMSAGAKVGNNFALVKAPQPVKKATLGEAGYKSFDSFKTAGDQLGDSETKLKERLDKIKEVGGKINSIIRGLKAKGTPNLQKADTVQVLLGACHAAVLANDLKYLRSAEVLFMDMVNQLQKQSKGYVKDENAGTTTP